MLRERTTIPRTIPRFLTIRYPGRSTPDVTIPASTLGMAISLERVEHETGPETNTMKHAVR
jgi:hypothetical protein